MRSRMMCGIAVLALIGALGAAPARAEDGCDLDAVLESAESFMQLGKGPEPVAEGLLQARQACPAAQDNFSLNFYLAFAELRLGRIDDAISHARVAAGLANDDEEQDRASRLVKILDEQLTGITFRRPDGGHEAVAVKLSRADAASLPSPKLLTDLLPGNMSRFVQDAFKDVLVRSQKQLAESRESPVRIWLPQGNYTLDTGQTLSVGATDLEFQPQLIRWSDNTSFAAMGMVGALPMPGSRIKFGDVARFGVTMNHAVRLGDNLLLGVELAYYGLEMRKSLDGLAPGSSSYFAVAELDAATADPHGSGPANARTVMASVGVVKPVVFTPRLPLLLGFYLRAAGVDGLTVLDSPENAQFNQTTRELGGTIQGGAYWRGLLPSVDVKLYYTLIEKPNLRAGVGLGLMVGMGMGGLVKDAVYEETGETYTIAPASGDRFLLMFGSQLGAGMRF